MEPTAEATITVSATITVRPEPDVTVEQKEAALKQQLVDNLVNASNNYDYGVAVAGSVSSSLSDTVEVDESKPDYEG